MGEIIVSGILFLFACILVMCVRAALKKSCWLAGGNVPIIIPGTKPKRYHEMNRRERREYLRYLKAHDIWDADVIWYHHPDRDDWEDAKERGIIITTHNK